MKREKVGPLVSRIMVTLILSSCASRAPDEETFKGSTASTGSPSSPSESATSTGHSTDHSTGPGLISIPVTPEKKYFKEILECRFHRPRQESVGHNGVRCIVAGQILWDSDHGKFESTNHSYHNHLTVACGGEKIYSDSATYTEIGEHQILMGSVSSNPQVMLMYPSKYPQSNSESLVSWLRIGDIQIEGACESEIAEGTHLEEHALNF